VVCVKVLEDRAVADVMMTDSRSNRTKHAQHACNWGFSAPFLVGSAWMCGLVRRSSRVRVTPEPDGGPWNVTSKLPRGNGVNMRADARSILRVEGEARTATDGLIFFQRPGFLGAAEKYYGLCHQSSKSIS